MKRGRNSLRSGRILMWKAERMRRTNGSVVWTRKSMDATEGDGEA